MTKMIDCHVSKLKMSVFAACGEYVQILDVKGRETARVMRAQDETVEDLTERAQDVCIALNIVFQKAD